MTIIEGIDVYLNFRSQTRKKITTGADFMHLSDFMFYIRDCNRDVSEITLEECESYLALTGKLGYDNNTRFKKGLVLKMFFEHMKLRGIPVQFEPELIPLPRREFRFPRVATEDSYHKILDIIPEEGKGRRYTGSHIRNKALIMVLHDSGARNGEVLSLDMEDIDLKRMSGKIRTEKSRGFIPFREIFWTAGTNEQLSKWLEFRESLSGMRDEQAIFIGVKGKDRGLRLRPTFVADIMRQYSKKAGLETVNPHSFRHEFGREMAMHGANNSTISSLLGHSQLQSSYPYTMLFGRNREEMYRNLRG